MPDFLVINLSFCHSGNI